MYAYVMPNTCNIVADLIKRDQGTQTQIIHEAIT